MFNLDEMELDALKGKRVLVTGGAGFIGSHLVEALLKLGAGPRVLDNFSTGFPKNIGPFGEDPNFDFMEGDICNLEDCLLACKKIDIIIHQAALGSVPRSIKDPLQTNKVNVDGFLNVLEAAKQSGIKRVVYAASSSTYGDSKKLPKVEHEIGKPLSPYAITKYVNELYASVYASHYGLELIGLRYFNVFGPRQDPKGAYAAVIPLFIQQSLERKPMTINGDGSIFRDFTYVENVVQANLKAAATSNPEAINQVYNVACGEKTNLIQLANAIGDALFQDPLIDFGPARPGDIQESLADISKAQKLLEYSPTIKFEEGIRLTAEWFKKHQTFVKKKK